MKNNTIRLLSSILIILMLMVSVSIGVSAETFIEDDGFKFTVESDNTVTIHGYVGNDENVTIPSTLLNKTVNKINEYAFMNNTTIKSVTIPTTVTYIDRGVFFGCTSLESVQLPKSCTQVGQYLFYGCTSLTAVTMPTMLKEVPRYCFSRCESLKSVTLPSTAKIIGDYAFSDCTELESVYVSRYTTSISVTAFEDSPQAVIYGYIDTYAYEFAIENSVPFSPVNAKPETYYVTFYDYDGAIFYSVPVTAGKSIAYPSKVPSKPATETHYYEFAYWYGNVTNIQQNEFLYPVFEEYEIKTEEPRVNTYNVIFLDGNDVFLEVQTVEEGMSATAPASIPSKAPTQTHYYVFKEWDTDFSNVTEDLIVRPVFDEYELEPEEPELKIYTVIFLDGDDVFMEIQSVEEGKSAICPDTIPTKAPTQTHYYVFKEWDTDFSNVTEDLIVRPVFDEYETEPEEPELKKYTVIFLDGDDVLMEIQTVEEGKSATAPSAIPTKTPTQAYSYAFTVWETDFSCVTENLVVRPVFEECPMEYKVTFLGADGTLIAEEYTNYGGTVATPDAPEMDGYTFVGWDKTFDIVTENITVTAEYEKNKAEGTLPSTGILRVEVSGGSGFSIAVNSGVERPQGTTYINSKMPRGAEVTLTAQYTDSVEFLGWINPLNGQIVATDITYTFVTSGNDYVKAMFATRVYGTQMVIFKNQKAGSNGRILDVQYYSSADEIIFPEAPTQVGYDFAGWSLSEDEIRNVISNGEDVTVIAMWERQQIFVDVTVVGGSGSGEFLANSAVTAVADEAPEGYKFAYWTDGDGNIKSYSSEYTFFPASDTTVIATFVSDDEEIDKQVIVNLDYIDYESQAAENKAVFGYSWYLPEEYIFVKAGILAVNEDNFDEATFYSGTPDTNVYDRASSSTESTGTSTWTKSNVFAGQTWVAKAYVQYMDSEGIIVTVYSENFKATRN